MKLFFKICLIISVWLLLNCSQKASLEREIEGKWQRGSIEFVFKGGAMAVLQTSRVYGSYEVIDTQTIRFQRDDPERHLDLLIMVSFPTSDIMIWQREYQGKLRDLWTFKRIK